MAQLPLPMGLGNPQGLTRIYNNPAEGTEHPQTWDAILVGGYLFGQTNYAEIRKSSLLSLSSNLQNATIIDSQFEIPETSTDPIVVFDENGGRKELFINTQLLGPGVSFQSGNQRIGIFSNFRIHASSSNIPENFGIYELNNSYETEIIDLDPTSISAASWLEIGGHWSKSYDQFNLGINAKYLRTHEGAFGNSSIDADFGFIDSTVMVNTPIELEFAFTTAAINSSDLNLEFNGSGFGIDIGGTFQYSDRLKFGASLLDIGLLSFSKNTEYYSMESLSLISTIRTQDYRNSGSIRSLIDQFQSLQNISPEIDRSFSIGLPTRLSLSFDYHVKKNIFLAGQISQRLPIFSNSLKSVNRIVINPSIQFKSVTLFSPVTIHEFRIINLGLGFQLGPVVLGTDQLTNLLFPNDLNSGDIYFAVHLYPFNGNDSVRNKSSVLCPKF